MRLNQPSLEKWNVIRKWSFLLFCHEALYPLNIHLVTLYLNQSCFIWYLLIEEGPPHRSDALVESLVALEVIVQLLLKLSQVLWSVEFCAAHYDFVRFRHSVLDTIRNFEAKPPKYKVRHTHQSEQLHSTYNPECCRSTEGKRPTWVHLWDVFPTN